MKKLIFVSIFALIFTIPLFSQVRSGESDYGPNYTQQQLNYAINHLPVFGTGTFTANKFADTTVISGLTSSAITGAWLNNPTGLDTVSCYLSTIAKTDTFIVVRSDTTGNGTIGYSYFYKQ